MAENLETEEALHGGSRIAMKDPKAGDLVICETRSAVWAYHLHLIGDDGFHPSGGDITSLCGKKMGWDTRIPLTCYGKQGNTPSSWCSVCMDEAKKKGLV